MNMCVPGTLWHQDAGLWVMEQFKAQSRARLFWEFPRAWNG